MENITLITSSVLFRAAVIPPTVAMDPEPHPIFYFDQISGAARGLELCCWGALGLSPYASPFVWFLFRYDCGAYRRRGVADRLTQHLNVRKRASQSPSCNRSDSYGRVTTALSREKSIASKE